MTTAPGVWQPTLTGTLICLRPLVEGDFEPLFAAASDPLIWEQHPERERYTRERFEVYFRTGIESKGALVAIDLKSGAMVGCSRFYNPEPGAIEIGYTFLIRACWGGGYNRELKKLMLDYAFEFVGLVFFYAGEKNFRSQAALRKIGATELSPATRVTLDGQERVSLGFQIRRAAWVATLRGWNSRVAHLPSNVDSTI
jgi:RimJ/RimL family protein N-acetyltransferase